MKRKFILVGIAIIIILMVLTYLSRTFYHLNITRVDSENPQRSTLTIRRIVEARTVFPGQRQISIADDNPWSATIDRIFVKPGQTVSRGDILATATPELALTLALKRDHLAYNRIAKPRDTELLKEQLSSDQRRLALEVQIYNKRKEIINTALNTENLPLPDGKIDLESLRKSLGKTDVNNLSILFDQYDLLTREAELLKPKNSNSERQNAANNLLLAELEIAMLKREETISQYNEVTLFRAPFDGVIVTSNIATGDQIDASKPLFTIAKTLRPGIKLLGVSADDLERLQKCRGAEITLGEMEFSMRRETAKSSDGVTRLYLWEHEKKPLDDAVVAMLMEDLTGTFRVTISGQTKLYDTTVSRSAVFQINDKEAVYLIEERVSFWGREKYIKREYVTVIDSGDKRLALEKKLKYSTSIVRNWYGPIKDGDPVTLYDFR